MKIEKLEYYSSSKDGYIWQRHPNIDDITDKINEIIDKLNERDNAEPVVRCMDCKYLQWNMRQDGSLPLGVDEYECRHWCGYCDPTDFCSYGERREDETN